jgi:hypothetical protein
MKHRNPLKFSGLKKVLYENYETIFMPRNLKSFRKKMPNLQSSAEHLFFLECASFIYTFPSRHLQLTLDQTAVNLSLHVQTCYNLSYD